MEKQLVELLAVTGGCGVCLAVCHAVKTFCKRSLRGGKKGNDDQ